MELRDFLEVKAICDAGSFRKAAKALGVTQPTLGTRIAHLEDQLGARLFDRDQGRSRPTQLAETIAARAAAIGRDASLLAKDIGRLASGRAGVVRIGLGPAPGRVMLGDIITRITTQFPQVSLSLAFGSTGLLTEQLLSRDLDIVVCHVTESKHPAILIELELEVGNTIVAHPDHRMFEGPEPGLAEVITQFPMAIPDLEQRYRDIVLDQYGIDVDRLPGSVFCSDFEVLLRLVTDRPWYFTAGPAFAFAPELADGRLKRLAHPVPFSHRVAIHTNREAFALPAVANVQQIIREVFAKTLEPYTKR